MIDESNEEGGNESGEEYSSFLEKRFGKLQNERSEPQSRLWVCFSWTANVVLTITVVVLMIQLQNPRRQDLYDADHKIGSYSPADKVIEYAPRQFYSGYASDTSPYQGWPDDEKDAMWKELHLDGLSFRIDEQEHSRLISKSERLPIPGQESDYVVNIQTFHHLHCLNNLRQSIYPKRYNSSLVDTDGTINYGKWRHLDHCIEALRQALTCNADVSVMAYQWASFDMMTLDFGGLHMCRNHDRIRDWAKERSVAMFDRRQRVEGGKIVDYKPITPDPIKWAVGYEPKGWDKTINDL